MIWVAFAGGCGAVARYGLNALITTNRAHLSGWSTLVINLTGSFLLGLLVGSITLGTVDPELQLILGTGFLGGYTTFSTACVESARLLRAGECRLAALLSGTMLLGSVLAAGLGMWLFIH
jgi:CrcB protein